MSALCQELAILEWLERWDCDHGAVKGPDQGVLEGRHTPHTGFFDEYPRALTRSDYPLGSNYLEPHRRDCWRRTRRIQQRPARRG